jgi:hypothetical protein
MIPIYCLYEQLSRNAAGNDVTAPADEVKRKIIPPPRPVSDPAMHNVVGPQKDLPNVHLPPENAIDLKDSNPYRQPDFTPRLDRSARPNMSVIGDKPENQTKIPTSPPDTIAHEAATTKAKIVRKTVKNAAKTSETNVPQEAAKKAKSFGEDAWDAAKKAGQAVADHPVAAGATVAGAGLAAWAGKKIFGKPATA